MSTEFRAAARAHVRGLAAKHGIELVWVSGWGSAEAWPDGRSAAVPRIRDGRSYLVALHELGHCLSRESRRLHVRYDRLGECACEGWAWAWAAANADPALARELTARDWRLVGSSFVSYLREAAVSPEDDPRYLGPPDAPEHTVPSI